MQLALETSYHGPPFLQTYEVRANPLYSGQVTVAVVFR